jgi:diguanylate cyclase (GGDEF)-like protein/PAS domain S-box-containing protein
MSNIYYKRIEGEVMQYRFVPYLWISMLLFLILILLIAFAWKRRTEKGVFYFLLTLILSAVWIAAQAMELASVSLSDKILWANIIYIPSTMVPVTYFYLAIYFMHRNHLLKKRWLHFLIIFMPITLNLLLWTNDYHGLIRQNISMDTSGTIPVVSKTYGPFFWVYATYNLILTLYTLYILMEGMREYNNRLQRAQAFALFMGLFMPTCAVLIFISKTTPIKIDPTPITIGLSSIFITWGILRYHLFDIISVAHSAIIKEMSTGMIILDNEGRVLEINPAACNMLGITLKKPNENMIASILKTYPELIHIYHNRINKIEEIAIDNQNGNNYYEVSYKQLYNSNNISIGWIFQIYDVTQRKIEEEKIKQLATHDSLTGLINRPYFEEVFKTALQEAKISGGSLAIAYMDLDDFKMINNTYGHDAGDGLLRAVANKFATVLEGVGLISRYGGDEFAILLPVIKGREIIEHLIGKVNEEFENSIEYNNIHIPIKASIGFSIYPDDGDNLDLLIKKADNNMYEIKRSRKGSVNINKTE